MSVIPFFSKRQRTRFLFAIGEFIGRARMEKYSGQYFDKFHTYYKTDGLKFAVPAGTSHRIKCRFVWDYYEQEERILLRKHLPRDAKVLELGACMGVISCVTNKLLSNPKDHVIVEVNPNLIATLEQNREMNSCGFEIFNGAVSTADDLKMSFNNVFILASSSHAKDNRAKSSVETKTITELASEYNIDFNCLVIDIEGAEYEFVHEFLGELKRFKTIFIEVHPNHLSEKGLRKIQEILSGAGFEMLEKIGDCEAWQQR
jgi:FkbM family methyltransferase